jgi:hypothetical protein
MIVSEFHVLLFERIGRHIPAILYVFDMVYCIL